MIAHYPIPSAVSNMLARTPDPWNDVATIGIVTPAPEQGIPLSVTVKALEDAAAMMRDTIGAVCLTSDSKADVTVTLPHLVFVVHRDARAWGHITIRKVWTGSDGHRYREVMISAENLKRGAVDVFGTLAHECAHALNLEADRRDCDVNGRHNRKFADVAESVFGLSISNHPTIGWSPTTVPVETQLIWSDVIARIADGLVGHCEHPLMGFGTEMPPIGTPMPRPRITGPGTGKRDKNNPKYTCACGESIRMSRKTYDLCHPICGCCGESFEEC